MLTTWKHLQFFYRATYKQTNDGNEVTRWRFIWPLMGRWRCFFRAATVCILCLFVQTKIHVYPAWVWRNFDTSHGEMLYQWFISSESFYPLSESGRVGWMYVQSDWK